ncbi:hypothetical protein RQM47_16000 [Rubrivirga sp. S365]|uniref:hypothetical protein n=1 Tax=Rubrivirga sp. S365 TaxID=3076080 RepID=UPI0028C5D684|nr:hypothetical protein [Rubrivirga sp. S365]MDT7858151.1 hypothetical protein [Rubrivirga sp. S365]
MLTSARPIFEHVPGSFADPVGLADQQALGVVALIVVRYDAAPPDGDAFPPSPIPSERSERIPRPSFPTYDAFVAVSGQLLAVARTTPDYRFPVMPAVALSRFIEARDAGRPPFLSLFELSQADCARFLETVFYSECLKLHVAGTQSAALVAAQIACSGCGNGVLEVNDFSDPAAPRVRLLDLDELALCDEGPDAGGAGDEPLTALLAGYLDGVTGRVLLYDRPKNQATLPARAGTPFDLDRAIEQANRLAAARRGGGYGPSDEARVASLAAAAERQAAAPDAQAEAVETYLAERAERPRLVAADHPHAAGLAALVQELQGGPAVRPAASPPEPTPPEAAPDPAADVRDDALPPASEGDPAPPDSGGVTAPSDPGVDAATNAAPPPPPPADRQVGAASAASVRPELVHELDRLRSETFALFENAVGPKHALEHEAHVLDVHGIPSPVPPGRTVEYVRALLTDDPPRRRHGFKGARARTYKTVAGKLLAFHGANKHYGDPVVHDVAQLWTRLHK